MNSVESDFYKNNVLHWSGIVTLPLLSNNITQANINIYTYWSKNKEVKS